MGSSGTEDAKNALEAKFMVEYNAKASPLKKALVEAMRDTDFAEKVEAVLKKFGYEKLDLNVVLALFGYKGPDPTKVDPKPTPIPAQETTIVQQDIKTFAGLYTITSTSKAVTATTLAVTTDGGIQIGKTLFKVTSQLDDQNKGDTVSTWSDAKTTYKVTFSSDLVGSKYIFKFVGSTVTKKDGSTATETEDFKGEKKDVDSKNESAMQKFYDQYSWQIILASSLSGAGLLAILGYKIYRWRKDTKATAEKTQREIDVANAVVSVVQELRAMRAATQKYTVDGLLEKEVTREQRQRLINDLNAVSSEEYTKHINNLPEADRGKPIDFSADGALHTQIRTAMNQKIKDFMQVNAKTAFDTFTNEMSERGLLSAAGKEAFGSQLAEHASTTWTRAFCGENGSLRPILNDRLLNLEAQRLGTLQAANLVKLKALDTAIADAQPDIVKKKEAIQEETDKEKIDDLTAELETMEAKQKERNNDKSHAETRDKEYTDSRAKNGDERKENEERAKLTEKDFQERGVKG